MYSNPVLSIIQGVPGIFSAKIVGFFKFLSTHHFLYWFLVVKFYPSKSFLRIRIQQRDIRRFREPRNRFLDLSIIEVNVRSTTWPTTKNQLFCVSVIISWDKSCVRMTFFFYSYLYTHIHTYTNISKENFLRNVCIYRIYLSFKTTGICV